MRIVVVGGTGLIGSKVVARLQDAGHEVTPAARSTGVNSYTGEGLEAALNGAETVIDLSNSSYTDQAGALEFFYSSTLNLLTYGRAAGVGHHVALSVVGTDRLAQTERGYFFAKDAQETLIRRSSVPYSLVHATQFFEFVRSIADAAGGSSGSVGPDASVASLSRGRSAASARQGRLRLAEASVQPIAGDDVAAAVTETTLGEPTNATREFTGPEIFALRDLVRLELRARQDPREVEADPLARYFGNTLAPDELLPGPDAYRFSTRFEDWLRARDRAESEPAAAR
ncbi:SDR family oxidoreductase [Herbiconiux solani]|uniref:SDR family oxidoreductase n=1 Tax=Herbiconiux solani TaxID=661329 RepID=UPI000825A991|nr:NAD-dependent epimerase/dehydratase family protein [Herbiconiux solani]